MRTKLFPLVLFRKQAKLTFRPQSCAWAHNTTHMGEQGSNQGYPICRGAWLMRRGAWGSNLGANFQLSSLFRAFFCLEISWNIEWISPYLYLLQKPFKNHWSSIFISLDPSCDVFFCWFSWFLAKKTQNTYGVAWFMITMNYNDSNKNTINCSSNHGQLL